MSDAVQSASVAAAPAPGGSSNWEIPKNLSAMKLLNETKSFVIVRALVCAVVAAIMFGMSLIALAVFLGFFYLMGKSDGGASGIIWIISIVFLGSVFGGLKWFLNMAKSVALYAIKAAHIAAITEYLKTGKTPVTEKGYKGVLAFGKEKVSKNLGTTGVFFLFDKLVAGATRQIMRWVNKAQNLLSFIPGSDKLFKFVNFILSTALNFVDEAILSYVFYHSEDKRTFKKACDGLVYYAQSSKGMLMGATKVAAFVWILRAICFVIFWVLFGVLIGLIPGIGAIGFVVGIVLASVVTYGVQTALIEPYATCMMIKDYHIAIAGQPLKADLYDPLMKASKSFRELFTKSKEEPAGIGGGEPVTVAAEAEVVSAAQ